LLYSLTAAGYILLPLKHYRQQNNASAAIMA